MVHLVFDQGRFVRFLCSVVPQELQTSPDHFILLTVVDWDMLSANDFMGEAYLSFQQILRGDMPTAIVDMDQIHLNLSKPPNTGKNSLHMIRKIKFYWMMVLIWQIQSLCKSWRAVKTR